MERLRRCRWSDCEADFQPLDQMTTEVFCGTPLTNNTQVCHLSLYDLYALLSSLYRLVNEAAAGA